MRQSLGFSLEKLLQLKLSSLNLLTRIPFSPSLLPTAAHRTWLQYPRSAYKLSADHSLSSVSKLWRVKPQYVFPVSQTFHYTNVHNNDLNVLSILAHEYLEVVVLSMSTKLADWTKIGLMNFCSYNWSVQIRGPSSALAQGGESPLPLKDQDFPS